MNKGAIIAIVIAILLAIGAGVFVLSNRANKSPQVSDSPDGQQTSNMTDAGMQKKSLKDLMGLGVTQECRYKDNLGNEGIVQTSGNNVRGKFTSSINGQITSSHMVSDDQFVYIWMEGQTQGMKMALSSMDDFSDAPDEQKGSVDLNQQLDYNCGTWVVDQSVFDIPTNVEFQDLSAMVQEAQEMMQEAQKETGNTKTEQCEACDSLTGSAKDSCRQALGC